MLLQIDIQNLAIMEKASVRFCSGLNVVTGETGSGKSILIKAISLLLGAKPHTDWVRTGCSQAVVSGQFCIPKNHEVLSYLETLGIASIEGSDEQYELMVRRSVQVKGRSYAWINDIPVTIASLEKIGDALIELFAQHENLKLLDPSTHRDYLDALLADHQILSKVMLAHTEVMTIYTELRHILSQLKERQKTYDYFKFRRDELLQFEPSQDDFKRISDLCQQSQKKSLMRDKLLHLQSLLDEGYQGESLSQAFWTCLKTWKNAHVDDEAFQDLSSKIQTMAAQLESLSYDVNLCVEQNQGDEDQLEQAQERLAQYQSLFRKLSVSDVEGILTLQADFEAHCEFVDSAADKVLQLLKQLQKNSLVLNSLSQNLSQQRKDAAHSLEKQALSEFKDLAMPFARLKVEFSKLHETVADLDLSCFDSADQALMRECWHSCSEFLSAQNSKGCDQLAFFLSTNKGEPLKALHKIASGGEISRIMMALKKIMMSSHNSQVLIFDEIDTGVSGSVADRVGYKMMELSKKVQVITISHLAQVAAYANHHICVSKHQTPHRSEVKLKTLDKSERIDEIARLLSSDCITASSKAHATTLIDRVTFL